MIKKKKEKKLTLTKTEERLLLYPPTESTWKCSECDMISPGSKENCQWCRAKKPDNPTLIFPLYLRACEKVGIIPYSCKWKYKEDTKVAVVFPTGGRRWMEQEDYQKGNDEDA